MTFAKKAPAAVAQIVLLALVVSAHAPLIFAQSAPLLLNYQARLTDSGGIPIAAPTSVAFTLLRGGTATEAVSSGTMVYGETATVTPDASGVFTHVIGTGTAAPGQTLTESDFDTSGIALYVEMSIGAEPLLPRTRVLSVPYAVEASRLGGLTAEAIIGQAGGNAFANAVVRNGAALDWLSVSQIRVRPGTLGFSDGVVRRNTSPITWDFANGTGLLGLDQGAETPNTWYYVFAVPDPIDDSRFSIVASTASPVQAGGTGPIGYGIHRFLGSIKNSSSSDLMPFHRHGSAVTIGNHADNLWLYRPSQAQVAVNTWVTVSATAFVPETGSAAILSGYYDAWCSAAITWYLGAGPAPPISEIHFITDWQNGAASGQATVPTVNRQFSYYASLHGGWSNDTCQHTTFYGSGYEEDLTAF